MENKRIQCRQCEGYGHIQAKYINTLKKGKIMVLIINNSETSKDANKSYQPKSMENFVAFVTNMPKIANVRLGKESYECS